MQWIWLARDRLTKKMVGFFLGARDSQADRSLSCDAVRYDKTTPKSEIVEVNQNTFSYLFDIENSRLISAWGISQGRCTNSQDSKRMKGHPLGGSRTHYHRGHAFRWRTRHQPCYTTWLVEHWPISCFGKTCGCDPWVSLLYILGLQKSPNTKTSKSGTRSSLF